MMRAFIYDMDGVIVDSEIIHMKAEKILLEDYGIQADEALHNDCCPQFHV